MRRFPAALVFGRSPFFHLGHDSGEAAAVRRACHGNLTPIPSERSTRRWNNERAEVSAEEIQGRRWNSTPPPPTAWPGSISAGMRVPGLNRARGDLICACHLMMWECKNETLRNLKCCMWVGFLWLGLKEGKNITASYCFYNLLLL